MTIPVTPQISLSPTSFSAAGQTITAAVSVLNRPAYHGKPKITGLTTITPKIIASRTPSGITPCHLMVSASETTCNAGDAYSDLHYEWDFGDTSGSETTTDYYNGKTVNLNNCQQGPEAAYIYRTAGEFTVTLTVKGKDENGDIVSASTTSILTLGCHYVFVGAATGGDYTLTFDGQTTAAIAYNASRSAMQSALEALSNLDSTNVYVRYDKCIEFRGDLAGQSYTFSADFTGLTGASGNQVLRTELASASSTSVTVSDQSGLTAQYFDSTYGGENGASDGTLTKPYATMAALRAWIIGGSNRAVWVKRGSSFVMDANVNLNVAYNTIRIAAYGSGANPQIHFNDAYHFVCQIAWATSAASYDGGDIIFSDIDFVDLASGLDLFQILGSNNGNTAYPYRRYSHVVLDNCNYTSTAATVIWSALWNVLPVNGQMPGRGSFVTGIHMWKCVIDKGLSRHSTLFVSHHSWFSCIGGSFTGGDPVSALDHNLYIDILQHSCCKYIGSVNTPDQHLSFFFNNNAVDDCDDGSQYYLFDGCEVADTDYGFDFSNSFNSYASNVGFFTNPIVQFCKVHPGTVGILGYNVDTLTVRNCEFWEASSRHISSGDTTKPTKFKLYRNRFYGNHIELSGSQTLYAMDNVFHGGSEYCIYHQGTLDLGLITADRNVWYAPSKAGPFFGFTGTVVTSFATWQGSGLDATGQNTDPLWSDPGNGVFIDNPTVAVDWPSGFASLEYSLNDGASWSSYTDDANQSIGSDISVYTEVLFRAITPTVNGTFQIGARSDSSSVEIAEETDSANLTGSGVFQYLAIQVGSLVLVLASEVNA